MQSRSKRSDADFWNEKWPLTYARRCRDAGIREHRTYVMKAIFFIRIPCNLAQTKTHIRHGFPGLHNGFKFF